MTTHHAKLRVKWQGSFNGRGRILAQGFETGVSLPKEFGGLGEGVSPEDLLLGSISSCYLITFGILLQKAGIRYENLTVEGTLLTKIGPPPAIEEVVLTVQVETETPQKKLLSLSEKVDGFCLIAKAIKGDIKKTVRIMRRAPERKARLESVASV